jgi:hypothetical protein
MGRWLSCGVAITVGARLIVACSPSSLVAGVDTMDSGGPDTSMPSGGEAGMGETGSEATTGTPMDAGEAGSCESRAWPLMLAAPIVPLAKVANLDMNHGGAGIVSLTYAQSVNCPLTTYAYDGGWLNPPSWPAQLHGTWGSQQDVLVSSDPTTSDLTSVYLQGGYAGAISFTSRTGGAYGSHSYTLGIGQLTRDGTPMTINWTGPSPFDEIFDGLLATFAPAVASVQACILDSGCYWGWASPGGSDVDAGQDAYYFVIKPLALGVGMNTVAQGGAIGWVSLDLLNGLPPGALDAGGSD